MRHNTNRMSDAVHVRVWLSGRAVSGSGNLRSGSSRERENVNTRHEGEFPCHIRDYYKLTALPCLSGDMNSYPGFTVACV